MTAPITPSPGRRIVRRFLACSAVLAVILVVRLFLSVPRRPPPAGNSGYAGSAACAACHAAEYAAWKDSHHARAQVPAPPAEGVADFTKAPAAREGDRFLLAAEGPDGKPARFPVIAAIGADPLVQVLVEFDRGRLQPTALAYDVRRKEWFDLHAPEPRPPDDALHWTGRGMTWNFQCAYCHTTDFKKRYDAERDVYASAWLEAGVGCEACHGPRDEHAKARLQGGPRLRSPAAAAGPADPDRRRKPPQPAEPSGTRSGSAPFFTPRPPDPAVQTCAPCHARRQQFGEGFRAELAGQPPGDSFLDFFDADLPDTPAYHPDGQIRDEDYEWASFLQSAMAARGVGCGDCHDPHSGKTRREGNALCLQCHKPELDTTAHTFHAAGGAGALCANCHMPQTTYMLRHPRRDHAFTSPLPELTVKLGIPNACNRCHRDKDAEWARERFEAWYGKRERPAPRRASLVAAAREGRDEAAPGLTALLADASAPAIWRAAAASLLMPWAGRSNVRRALDAALRDPEPLVRSRAARTLGDAVPQGADSPLLRLLRDPVRLVRIDAAWALRSRGADDLAPEHVQPFLDAQEELYQAARYNADHPAGRLRLGLYHYYMRRDPPAAEREYRLGLRLDPRAYPVRAELSVLLARQGRTVETIPLLAEGIRLTPKEPSLHYCLALAFGETDRIADVIQALETTARLDPRYRRVQRNLGVAYVKAGRPDDARRALEEALRQDPDDAEALQLLHRLR